MPVFENRCVPVWITNLLTSQIRKPAERRVGIEIERIGIWEDGTPFQYHTLTASDGTVKHGAEELLQILAKKHGWPYISDQSGHPLGLSGTGGKVSLEPGSQ